jgi:hypothetical protein
MMRISGRFVGAIAALGLALSACAPAGAQVKSVDPDKAIDGDLVPISQQAQPGSSTVAAPSITAPSITAAPVAEMDATARPVTGAAVTGSSDVASAAAQAATNPTVAVRQGGTYKEDDLIGAAEGVFGKGAKGLADLIKDLLKKQGEPNGYIVGREGGGAVVVGLRYGSGTLYHKVEGQQPVYWTGPSVGFDLGANAANTFVLVYNLYDTKDLFARYGAGEGQAYLIGGFNVSYLRRGDVVLIPVRMGVGMRLGINAGYMKFTHKANWLPF